jgi:phenylalanyl-tRNA synthetase alpha chain
MRDQIQNLKNEALAQIMDVSSETELDELRIAYLGRNGKINELFKSIKDVTPDERREFGQTMNEVKKAIEEEIEYRKDRIEKKDDSFFDPTIPGIQPKLGHFHPTTHVVSEMTDIFKHLGFSVYEGPEIESDVWNFEKLNLPKDHPARSLQDALYIEDPEVVLRTHTSSV